MRIQHALLIVVAVCAVASCWEPAAKFVETFGYIFVAIVAVWHQQFIALVSPARARVALLCQPCEKWQDDPEPSGHVCIHGKVWAANPDRPLLNARVLFDKIKYDEGPVVVLPVPFQFPWAPGESDREGITVGKDYEVFDLGMFVWLPSSDPEPYNPINPAPGLPMELGFSVARRRFQGGFPMGEGAYKNVKVFFFLRADNLREDHRMVFEVAVQQRTLSVKEWGTDY